jgi:hypothetical protein
VSRGPTCKFPMALTEGGLVVWGARRSNGVQWASNGTGYLFCP